MTTKRKRTTCEKFRIESIVPATGWSAVYFDSRDGSPIFDPLIVWAFGRDVTVHLDSFEECQFECGQCGPDPYGGVKAIVADGRFMMEADDISSLVGYSNPGDSLEDWTARCREEWEHQKRMAAGGEA